MNVDDRYDREHSYGEVRFQLSNYYPNIEECRFLFMKVIEQAVRDYCALYNAVLPAEVALWETAKGFLFEDIYIILWGEQEMNFEDILDVLDVDIDWFREQTIKKFNIRRNNDDKKR